MSARPITTVFFDLGDTLGVPMLSPPPPRLASFDLFPFVLPLLAELKTAGLRLGVISNTGDETGADVDRVLEPTGVLAFLEPSLRIYSRDVGMTKADPAIFALAAARAGHANELDRCLFVGENAGERATAIRAGMAVCPHPQLIREVIDDHARSGEISMSSKSRQLDTRKEKRAAATRAGGARTRTSGRAAAIPEGLAAEAAVPPAVSGRTSALTGAPAHVAPASAVSQDALIDRALAFVRRDTESFGFRSTDVAEFVPDPIVQRTSSGSAAVHLHQRYRGLPVFQMARTVRFNPQSQAVDATGDSASLPPGLDIIPKVEAALAVLKAAQHVAATTDDDQPDQYGQAAIPATIDVREFEPTLAAAFPALAPRPVVFEKGPFENPIPAHLLIFNQVDAPRLAWHIVLTLPNYADQYVAIVAADDAAAEILYCKSTVHRVRARGRVFEFNPGVADRRFIDFPRPIADYPVTPSVPLFGFPRDWVTDTRTIGNSTQATLNVGTTTLTGSLSGSTIVFDPTDPAGDDQKLLNIFYFCNYMHNFLFILGFDEPAGNFQTRNATLTGLGGDPVRARAHSGTVRGTANMATGPDGNPPLMNMGLVAGPNRHTAFDADVVFHEYVHGLTNRLAGGPLDTGSMTLLQPAGLGEGYSDFFALTLLNFFRSGPEKVVLGDWVVADPKGLRRAPYDENYPFTFGDMSGFPEEHDMGEVWCAALMSMTRRVRAALGSDQEGYRLAWQIVVDGLKLISGNPTYLDARDGILRALDDLRSVNRITAPAHAAVRKAAWQAFARFGMGVNAMSPDPDDVDNIVGDNTLPADLTT